MLEFRHISIIFIVFYISISPHLFECDGFALFKTVTDNVAYDQRRISGESEMKRYMDETVDPCNDFYKFACGKWPEIYPANGANSGYLDNLRKAHDVILDYLLKVYKPERDNEIGTKIKDFHNSCIIFVNQIREGEGDYQKRLRDIIADVGEMPALCGDAWQADNFDWLEAVAKAMIMYNTRTLIELDYSADETNNTIYRLYVEPQKFLLGSKSAYIDKESASDREDYVNFIAKRLRQYLDFDRVLAQNTAKEIVKFETALAHGMVDEKLGQSMKDLLNLTTVRALSEKYAPILNFERLMKLTLGVEYNEPLYEYAESYFLNLAKVLENTPKRIVANYIFYQVLDTFALTGTMKDIDKVCLEGTKKIFPKQLENMLYRWFNKTVIYINGHELQGLWSDLKQAFADEINSKRLEWISENTREKILEKLAAMRLEINSFEDENLSDEFKGVQIDEIDYLENMKNILKMKSENLLGQIRNPPNFPPPDVLDDESLSYTPEYIAIQNTVRIPVIHLLRLSASKLPDAVMCGSLGYITAHEIIHGFDDSGREYDKRGNLNNWWDEASVAAFDQRKLCFIDQYSNYSYGGRQLPRSQHQGENIADNGGIRIAYTLYLRWLEQAAKQGIDLSTETYPSMNYTSKQLFFISFAQVCCNDIDPGLVNQEIAEVHAPYTVRVHGTLSNLKEFSQEFGCAVGSPMNPINKCELF